MSLLIFKIDFKVKCFISSENEYSEKIEFLDSKRKLFQRGAIDSFIILPSGSIIF